MDQPTPTPPTPATTGPAPGPRDGTPCQTTDAGAGDAGPGLLELAARLRVEQRRRWQQGERPRAEEYLQKHTRLAGCPEAALDLIYAEALLREESGEAVSVAEYVARFPHLEGPLRRQFQLHHGLQEDRGSAATTTAPRNGSQAPTLDPAGAPGVAAAGAGAGGVSVPGFEVLGVLGEGGMGVVYKARQVGLNRVVALKTIRPPYVADAHALARFRREAEAVAGLQHPHIIAVHAWGEHGGVPCFALEYCAGGSLNTRVKGQPQPPAEAARLVEKVARAVQAAHDAGVVHRDLKPGNVLLAPAGDEPALNTIWGVPKVADFGLCHLAAAGVAMTAEGETLGSPPYMAPEQAEGRASAVGPATDVYALGAILYELLAGRPPFTGGTMSSILYQVCHKEPVPLRQLRPDVPPALEAVCLRCLSKQPEDRYPRAADLAEALRRWPAEAGLASCPAAPPTRGGPLPAPRRGSRWDWRPLGAAMVLAGLLGLGAWAWSGRHASSPPSAPVAAGPSPASGTKEPDGAAPVGKPLTVRLRVRRFVADGRNQRLVGELGEDTYRARLNDRVEVDAELSEPAYAYLIAFNPAANSGDLEQPVPRAEADRPPQRRDGLTPDKWIKLDDGVGLQAFAVVASRQPLPAYTYWRQQRPPLPWRRTPATSGVVWRVDGGSVEGRYEPGLSRGTEEAADDKAALRALARQLGSVPGVQAVAVVGFAVDSAE
jgi:serine/threonine-protein kinase